MADILQRITAACPFTDMSANDYTTMRQILDNSGLEFALFMRPLYGNTDYLTYSNAEVFAGFYTPTGATFTEMVGGGRSPFYESVPITMAAGEFKFAFKGECVYPTVLGLATPLGVADFNSQQLYTVHAHVSIAARKALLAYGAAGPVPLVDGYTLVRGVLTR